MRAQDLEAAPDEKRQEKKVEKVRRTQPKWIIKRHHWAHSQAWVFRPHMIYVENDSDNSKFSFDHPYREPFALADKVLCRVSMNEFP